MSVDAQRSGGIVFRIRGALLPTEYIVGGDMNEGYVRFCGNSGQACRSVAVDRERAVRLRFGLVDGRIRPGIDDCGRLHSGDYSLDGRLVLKIELGSPERNEPHAGSLSMQCKAAGQLSALADDEDSAIVAHDEVSAGLR